MENQLKSGQALHSSVLASEVCQGLDLHSKKIIVDGTLGLGGHTALILKALPKDGSVIGFDLDKENLKIAKENLTGFEGRVVFINHNFSTLLKELKKRKIKGIDGILLDLGLSSVHVDNPEKGFSFLKDGPLDMRYGKKQELTAAEVVNKYSHKELLRIFREFGEEPQALRIADQIIFHRRRHPFSRTLELAQYIERFIKRTGHIHPATRIFQALRIEVNHELDVLQEVLMQAVQILNKNGRIAVISYHSLEDRLVKQFFQAQSRDFINVPGELTTRHLEPTLKIVTRKPIVPGAMEIKQNPRSRSAKLRIAERI